VPRFRTSHTVFAALACLTLAAGAWAVWAEHGAFPPALRGFGEVTPRGEVAGWAVDSSRPAARVEVELYLDGRFAAHAAATLPRPDVVAAGRADDESCGYRFALSALAPGPHEARVYALHARAAGAAPTLKQLGDTLHFTTDAKGRVINPAPR
jgi:hypothetical protein